MYAHTRASSDEKIDKFYNDLDVAHKFSGSQDMRIVIGDINAKVVSEQDPSMK